MQNSILCAQLEQRYNHILNQIQDCRRDRRNVDLLAVSKTHSSEMIRNLYHLGQRKFGENYLQESLPKIQELADLEIEWHFIGHVQRNKTKLLAENFSWVHGVDRVIIAERLSAQRPAELQPLNICLQVNIDQQESKDGCEVSDVAEFVKIVSNLDNLRLRGLMIIPKPGNIKAFDDAKLLFEQMRDYHQNTQDWDTLSMGMSGDLIEAIHAGSTMVRVGTALFGERDYK